MLVRLVEPCNNNWILMAEGLNDPAHWTRFSPFSGKDSDRTRFDEAVRACPLDVQPVPCKSLLREGRSAFEYDWSLTEEAILEHSLQVAEALGLELQLGEPSRAA